MDDSKRDRFIRFLSAVDKLNEEGKKEALNILKDMLSQSKYRETSQRVFTAK